MTYNTFGRLLRVTTWGESHGAAIGCVIDGTPPGIPLAEGDIQPFLDRRRPGASRYTTQRREADAVRILSGTYEGETTGTPIALVIENTDQRSKDYAAIAETYRPGHADYTYDAKYGRRDPRGGGRASARETAMRVAAGAIARKILGEGVSIRAALVEMGGDAVDRDAWDWEEVGRNPFDIPEAPTEIVAGYQTEYSSVYFVLIYLGEFLHIFLGGALAATLFLGGPSGPVLPGFVWFYLKIWAVFLFTQWARSAVPRVRIDQLIEIGWKGMLVMSLANLVLTAVIVGVML